MVESPSPAFEMSNFNKMIPFPPVSCATLVTVIGAPETAAFLLSLTSHTYGSVISPLKQTSLTMTCVL